MSFRLTVQSFIAETDTAGDRRKAATASTMQSILFETNEKHEPGKLEEDGRYVTSRINVSCCIIRVELSVIAIGYKRLTLCI